MLSGGDETSERQVSEDFSGAGVYCSSALGRCVPRFAMTMLSFLAVVYADGGRGAACTDA